MKNYVRYNTAGDILTSGQCSTAKFERLKKEGVLILEGVGNDGEHKIEGGIIVSKGEKIEKRPRLAFPAALISEGQWQNVLKRIEDLESIIVH